MGTGQRLHFHLGCFGNFHLQEEVAEPAGKMAGEKKNKVRSVS